MIEVIAVIALLGIMATVAVSIVGNTSQPSTEVRVQSDAATLNRAVTAYLFSNGNLDDCKTAVDVIQRLATPADSDSSGRILGFTGSFADAGLQPEFFSSGGQAEGRPGIRWDPSVQRFQVVFDGTGEIRGFKIDENVQRSGSGETRDAFMSLAQEDTWIWDYQDAPATLPTTPETINTSTTPTTLPPSSQLPPTPTPTQTQLQAPTFSIPGSTRPISDFDLAVNLANPNPNGSSHILYSLDFGPWIQFTGAGLSVPAGSTLKAQVISDDSARWKDSSVATEVYQASTVALDPPVITSSSNWGEAASGGGDIVSTVFLANPNSESLSSLRYRIDGGGLE